MSILKNKTKDTREKQGGLRLCAPYSDAELLKKARATLQILWSYSVESSLFEQIKHLLRRWDVPAFDQSEEGEETVKGLHRRVNNQDKEPLTSGLAWLYTRVYFQAKKWHQRTLQRNDQMPTVALEDATNHQVASEATPTETEGLNKLKRHLQELRTQDFWKYAAIKRRLRGESWEAIARYKLLAGGVEHQVVYTTAEKIPEQVLKDVTNNLKSQYNYWKNNTLPAYLGVQ